MRVVDTGGATRSDPRLDRMAAQLDELVAEQRRQREQRQAWEELAGDLAPVARQALGSTTTALDDLDRRGYTEFARSGLGVVDRVVASFDAADVEALGDNIVLILETVKEMTQPEVMTMLRRTAAQVGHVDEPADPPSVFALLRELRDPEVRRGLARVLAMLGSIGTAPDHPMTTNPTEVQ